VYRLITSLLPWFGNTGLDLLFCKRGRIWMPTSIYIRNQWIGA